MSEAPNKLISAIRHAGISVDPSHPNFKQLTQDVWVVIEHEAGQLHEILGRNEQRMVDLLVAEVRAVMVSQLLRVADADHISNVALIFNQSVRRRASEVFASRNRRVGGYADAPPTRVHDYKPIKRPGGRKFF